MQQIPQPILEQLETTLDVRVSGFNPASGGCINNGGELQTNAGSYFIKWNNANRFPNMFKAEAIGLELLYSKKCISIPNVILVDEVDGLQFICMEFIRSAPPVKKYWSILGERLAILHKNSSEQFGLDHDNYIGSLAQNNTFRKSWIDFFIEQRLEVQLLLGEKNKLVDASMRKKFDALHKRLNELLPEEKPALLHGDLWSGNLHTNQKGEPCLIDPAVYYGHREAELAFTKLFGGFDLEFYEAYNDELPIEPEFDQRIEIYNLYPLLVHANLFGAGYIRQVRQILQAVG